MKIKIEMSNLKDIIKKLKGAYDKNAFKFSQIQNKIFIEVLNDKLIAVINDFKSEFTVVSDVEVYYDNSNNDCHLANHSFLIDIDDLCRIAGLKSDFIIITKEDNNKLVIKANKNLVEIPIYKTTRYYRFKEIRFIEKYETTEKEMSEIYKNLSYFLGDSDSNNLDSFQFNLLKEKVIASNGFVISSKNLHGTFKNKKEDLSENEKDNIILINKTDFKKIKNCFHNKNNSKLNISIAHGKEYLYTKIEFGNVSYLKESGMELKDFKILDLTKILNRFDSSEERTFTVKRNELLDMCTYNVKLIKEKKKTERIPIFLYQNTLNEDLVSFLELEGRTSLFEFNNLNDSKSRIIGKESLVGINITYLANAVKNNTYEKCDIYIEKYRVEIKDCNDENGDCNYRYIILPFNTEDEKRREYIKKINKIKEY